MTSKGRCWALLPTGAASAIGKPAAFLVYDHVSTECLSSVWEGGRQPAEVSRVVKRKLSVPHVDSLAAALSAFDWPATPMPLQWAAQLEELGAIDRLPGLGRGWLEHCAESARLEWLHALRVGAHVLGVLLGLHVLKPLMATPSQWWKQATFSGRDARLDGFDPGEG